ncbi:MAG: excinuclease ABC subunit UvrA [Microgenomates group bacterium]
METIKIKGARQHNLKNINLEIPKNKLVVITGVSGSGKSSLALDTIYAEGQRRYVQSLSAYARQFLGIMDKPEVDLIEGLSPAIAIDQKTVTHNPRSTVGTITEIYDYLRLLFARIGHPHCPNCRYEISKLSIDEIVDKVLKEIERIISSDKIKPFNFEILSPIVRKKKGEFKDLFNNLLAKGFNEVYVDNRRFLLLKEEVNLIKTNYHNIEVIVDKFSITYKQLKDQLFFGNLKSRLFNSIEQSLNLSNGLIILKNEKASFLFSEKFACPKCNISLPELEPRMFSFNSPLGACEKCHGLGTIYRADPNLILNPNLSINEGAIVPFANFFWQDTWYIRLIKKVTEEEGIDLNTPLKEIAREKIKILLYGTGKIYRVLGKNRLGRLTAIYEKFDGLINELERRYFENSENQELNRFFKEEICDLCLGKRLKKEILSITIDDLNIADVCDMTIEDLHQYYENEVLKKISDYEKIIAKPILKEIIIRLTFLKNVGLSYLNLSRAAKTLSGGELQRIRLASQIGSGLTDVLYVLDEPSIGLHAKDVKSLIDSLILLKNIGNTLIVVEHDRETIEAADYVIELGPLAGKEGGKLVFSGTLNQLKKANTLTGQFLTGKRKITRWHKKLNKNQGEIILRGASQYNLKNITVHIPLGNLIAVTGVSGSGKSALITDTLYPALKYYLDGYYKEKIGKFEKLEGYQYIDKVYLVDQSPIGRTPRSNPATYVNFFDEIREIFAQTLQAKAKGFKKSRFSFNLKGGRCEKCQGAGYIKIEMQFLSDVYVTCDVCQGKRYNQETLSITYKGKNIYDVLKMTIKEGLDFFRDHPKIYSKLIFLEEVGLGYLELGQPAPSLSGGESQRIKLAHELTKKNTEKTLYILDEPTTGLHFYDVNNLLKILYQLVERGNTVIVIEHNLDLIKNCQYIIDLGPEGGNRGGKIVYQGEIDGIINCKQSYTGYFLKKFMK